MSKRSAYQAVSHEILLLLLCLLAYLEASIKAIYTTITREILYSLVRTEGRVPSSHDTATLRKWVHIVGEKIGVPLKATQSVMSAIWQRAAKVGSQFKKLKGGRQQHEYLQVELKLEVQYGDLLTTKEKELQKELSSANKENERLQSEVTKVKEVEEKLTATVKVLSEQVSFNVVVYKNSSINKLSYRLEQPMQLGLSQNGVVRE